MLRCIFGAYIAHCYTVSARNHEVRSVKKIHSRACGGYKYYALSTLSVIQNVNAEQTN